MATHQVQEGIKRPGKSITTLALFVQPPAAGPSTCRTGGPSKSGTNLTEVSLVDIRLQLSIAADTLFLCAAPDGSPILAYKWAETSFSVGQCVSHCKSLDPSISIAAIKGGK